MIIDRSGKSGTTKTRMKAAVLSGVSIIKTEAMRAIIEKYKPVDEELNAKKRFACYQDTIRETYKRKIGRRKRIRMGWCFQNIVKPAFPSEEYTGFIAITGDTTSTSDTSTQEIIDLSY